ncbi:MAG TPA: GH92 family glycosyl hydrolase [Candidatus Acidoferrales bacterium]|nr:GH92 family glycosyl hydrolase [Candidatus Acidoferrales bacterium]
MRTLACISVAALFAAGALANAQEKNPDALVDPFIGTAAHGHVFPGATLPFGMVQLSPDEEVNGWDWCSGYNYSSKTIMGFSHTHLSGTGAMDYGDILFMPTVGKVRVVPGTDENPDSGYRSSFSHSTEKASPGYYSVFLDRYGVRVKLTVTYRCGLHEYSFPRSDSSNIVIDLQHGIGNTCTGSWIKIVGDKWVEGMRRSHGWANDRCIYFVAQFSKPFRRFGTANGDTVSSGNRKQDGDNVKAFVTFSTTKDEVVLVRVGISAVSLDGARKNLAAEMPDFDFTKYRMSAQEIWNKALGKIRVEGGTESEERTFYTALYHSMMHPNVFQDVDGRYYGMDQKIHTAKNFVNYTVFSLWDTFRAFHPLMTIIDPNLDADFVKTLVEKYREARLLPVWELAGNETYTMIGYPSVPLIFDAYEKGLVSNQQRGINLDTALSAMEHSAEMDWQGLKYYKERGFIPADKENESVSKTLEYAYDDWCIAQLAKRLGKRDVYRQYNQRSLFYRNVFDSSAGFMRGKLSNGKWYTPFDPYSVSGNYTEANAWQYSFFVPQDIGGLINLYGGKEKFASKLDSLFSESSQVTGRYQPDISGMVGQDAQGNEPSHHVPYLYDYAGEPWKTQRVVREIISKWYTDKVDGLCGNDDCGQMSAWYVFSAMGFYPVTPGQNTYVIGSPLFRKITIELGKGKTFMISAENASDENMYIQSSTLDGKPYDMPYLTHSDIMKGGTLALVMSNVPDEQWGLSDSGLFIMAPNHNIIPMPEIESTGGVFYDSTVVSLNSSEAGSRIRYTLDGDEPDSQSPIYVAPVTIHKPCTLKAAAFSENSDQSMTSEAKFVKSFYPPATYRYPFAAKYTGGGPMALTDGREGTTNYQTGEWQGFEGTDLDVVIDLEQEKKIDEVSTGFLQDTGVWIFLPEYVEYYVSQDGKDFKKISEIKNDVDPQKQSLLVKHFTVVLDGIKARYLRVVAKNIGVCPPWHVGAGGKAWLFVDEVKIQ